MKKIFFLFSALFLLFICTYSESYDSQNRLISSFELNTTKYHTPFVNEGYSPKNTQLALGSIDHPIIIYQNTTIFNTFIENVGTDILISALQEKQQLHNSTPSLLNFKFSPKETRSTKKDTFNRKYLETNGEDKNIHRVGTKLFDSIKSSNDLAYVIVERILTDNQLIYYT